jgi:hypothetical protein
VETITPKRDQAIVESAGFRNGPALDTARFRREEIARGAAEFPRVAAIVSTATYDSNRNAVLFVLVPYPSSTAQLETWRIWLPPNEVAERIPVSTPPSARQWHTIIHEPTRDRLILFGGTTLDGAPLNDVWALDFATLQWTPLPTIGQPPHPETTEAGTMPAECSGSRSLRRFGADCPALA